MKQAFEDVKHWMDLAGQQARERPEVFAMDPASRATTTIDAAACHLHRAAAELSVLPLTRERLRARLLMEELAETLDGILQGDVVAVADGLADLCVVAIGAAVSFGIPLPAVWDEVMRSNPGRLPVVLDASGKVTQPEVWTTPDIAGVLAREGGKS